MHKDTLQYVPLNPLQKPRIPFEAFSAPLKISEDLSYKDRTYKAELEQKYKDVSGASDLFEIKGERAEHLYMLGAPGRGKTGQCYQLLYHWLEAREAQRENRKLSEWQKDLSSYDLMFLVTLRHVDVKNLSVVEMVCQNALKLYPKYHDTVRQILKGCLYSCKCLIVLDGLDEIQGEPSIDVDIASCTVLMTTRHWKFHLLSPVIKSRDRVVEVFGLNKAGIYQVISKLLQTYFDMDPSTDHFQTKVREMFNRARNASFKSIMKIPLVLTASVHLWQSNTFLDESMTYFFASLVNLLIKIGLKNKRVTCNLCTKDSVSDASEIPFIKEKPEILEYFGVLLALGKVAYEDLSTDKYQLPEDEKRNKKQLVFNEKELEKKLGKHVVPFAIEIGKQNSEINLGRSVLQFALDIGILSKASAPGYFDEENVSINFFHKTVEEFLAALYIAYSDQVGIHSFLESCSSLRSLMELSNVLMFLVGIAPKLGNAVSTQFSQSADSDSDITRYRQKFEDDDNSTREKVKHLFKNVCDCYLEMKNSLNRTQPIETTDTGFKVSDVYVDSSTDETIATLAREFLSEHNSGIVSLNIHCDSSNEAIPFEVINGFLDNSTSLRTLHINGGRVLDEHEDYDIATFNSIGDVFSSLTVLSLCQISLTSSTARALQEAILGNTCISVLRLQFVDIQQPIPDVPHWMGLLQNTGSDVTPISLDLKDNKELRTLNVTCFANVLVANITQCRSLTNLILNQVRVQSADMLQEAVSSLTQLKNLNLKKISFSDKNHKLGLDLASCRDLTSLHLSMIYVETIEISPLKLHDMEIEHVSGSLRGLLSALSNCEHLRLLGIKALYNKQDAIVLMDVLPQLTQVRYMSYSGGNTRNMITDDFVIDDIEPCRGIDHAAVAQATTRMTGLKSLDIWNIDLDDLALTLSPLMSEISIVNLNGVNMTSCNWDGFIKSLLDKKHGFDIQLFSTNIDDKSLSTVHSCPHFKMAEDAKRDTEGSYRALHTSFSKLQG